MYNNKKVLLNNNHGKKVIKNIFKHINKNPKKYLHFINKNNKERAIADYISGMTDRYALNIYKSIK